MADTTKIKTIIEPYVRDWLSKRYHGHVFKERSVQLTGGGSYAFDAVADDGSIVAAILCNRAATRTERENTGGVRKALPEIGYLKAVPAGVERLMVFANRDFCDLIQRRGSRLGTEKIQMIVCTLPPDLEALLMEVLDQASHEQSAAE
ncbi:hypothetical protein ACFLWX_04575 [Chloroflexota bacterium]